DDDHQLDEREAALIAHRAASLTPETEHRPLLWNEGAREIWLAHAAVLQSSSVRQAVERGARVIRRPESDVDAAGGGRRSCAGLPLTPAGTGCAAGGCVRP